ncbi:MAG TPA: hypothetical protein VGC30_10400 [Dokdonella sp.]
MKQGSMPRRAKRGPHGTQPVGSGAARRVRGAAMLAAAMLAATATANAAVQGPQGTLQFYADEAAFDAALGIPLELTTETFDGGAPVGPFPTNCGDPMSSASDDACFTPGELVPGFSISATSGTATDLSIFPTGFIGPGQTGRAVGAATFTDKTIVSFDPPATATAAKVYGGTSISAVDVEVFDTDGNSLGTTVVPAGATRDAAQFIGVTSPTPIGKVTFDAEVAGTGELIEELQFRPAGLTPPGLALAFSPSGVAAGETSTLTITLGNQGQAGPATLTAALADELPDGLVVAATPNASTDCADADVTATAGGTLVTLGAGAQIPAAGLCSVTVSVTAAVAGLYTDTLAAGALETDLGSNRDAATASLKVISGQSGTFPPAENFDEVFAPNLPDGWIASTTTGTDDWTTTTDFADTAPNAAYAGDANTIADYTLDSPAFTPVAGQTVAFRHRFNFERRFDGAVLEISIDGGEFEDIVAAGGHFVTGGYGSVALYDTTGNPIGGRAAWTGDSAGFVTTIAALPAAAAGHPTRLRFRTADDASNVGFPTEGTLAGWWIDSIVLGVGTQPPAASVSPATLAFAVDTGASATETLTLANATGSDPLTFSVEPRSPSAAHPTLVPYARAAKKMLADADKPLTPRPLTTLAAHGAGISRPAASTPWAPQGSLVYQLDDGSAETALGAGTGSVYPPAPFTESAAVYINRFSASDALTIHSISVFWPEIDMAGGDLAGLQANLVVYYDADADGDPSNAVRVGTDKLVPISTTGDFQTYATDFEIPAAGDVYIGFVDQWSLAGGFTPRLYPAALDTTQPLEMSYLSSADTPPVDIDHLGNNAHNGTIGEIEQGALDGNWMVRAAVTGGGNGGPCSGPLVDWLSATPVGGTVEGGSSVSLAVTVDAAAGGLTPGVYSADLCLVTNDPARPILAVPVDVTVGAPPPTPCSGGADELFCDGFDGVQSSPSIVSGTIDQPVAPTADGSAFNFVTGDYHPYDPSLTDDDANFYDPGDGTLAGYWYGDFVPDPQDVGAVADASGEIAVLHSGDSIGPASPLHDSAVMVEWLAGTDGYVGIAFWNENTGSVNYGYLHLTTTGPTGYPAQLLDWAYDSSGASITIP